MYDEYSMGTHVKIQKLYLNKIPHNYPCKNDKYIV